VATSWESFSTYWGTHGGYGSWAARREMVRGTFDPLHEDLEKIEEGQLREDLVEPVSPKDLTGWPAVDVEIAELRRHFHQAQTPQDYRNIGNDVSQCLRPLARLLTTRSDTYSEARPNRPSPRPRTGSRES
jgi:hypothetical protein